MSCGEWTGETPVTWRTRGSRRRSTRRGRHARTRPPSTDTPMWAAALLGVIVLVSLVLLLLTYV
ncbi:hypothetical protein ACFXGA_07645 [Actinosynnema sp. NPDC059335]|uniref:hypothetical protein n=1 Tax=Actinosynnema sp. NPDC059335 TaxID=3346804 RepID=UPI00367284F6